MRSEHFPPLRPDGHVTAIELGGTSFLASPSASYTACARAKSRSSPWLTASADAATSVLGFRTLPSSSPATT